jgi:hypothetical protein
MRLAHLLFQPGLVWIGQRVNLIKGSFMTSQLQRASWLVLLVLAPTSSGAHSGERKLERT